MVLLFIYWAGILIVKTNYLPFEGILGHTVELRIMERLIASPDVEFNITELAEMAGVHRDSASLVIQKFLRWNMLTLTSRKGNVDRFKLNPEEPLVTFFTAFNEAIIMQLFPEMEGVLGEDESAFTAAFSKKVGAVRSCSLPCANVSSSSRERALAGAKRSSRHKDVKIFEELAKM